MGDVCGKSSRACELIGESPIDFNDVDESTRLINDVDVSVPTPTPMLDVNEDFVDVPTGRSASIGGMSDSRVDLTWSERGEEWP